MLPAVERAAVLAGKSGFIASQTACAPLLHVERLDAESPQACAGFNDAVLAFLQGRDDIPLVVLAARWALAAEGTRPEAEGGDVRLRHETLALPSGKAEDDFAIFAASLRETVAAVRSTGRQVVILGGIPEIGWSVPETLAQSTMNGTPLPPVPTADEVERRNARAAAVLGDLATQPGVRFLPLTAVFCDPDCAVEDRDARPAYVDDDHLSWSGADAFLAPLLIETLWPREPRLGRGRSPLAPPHPA